MRYSQCVISKAEIKWNEQFSDETLQWKNIYLNIFKSKNDIKLCNFQYKCIMCIVPTNQFFTKCNIVGSALCEFCNMEIETVSHLVFALFVWCLTTHQPLWVISVRRFHIFPVNVHKYNSFWTSVSDLLRVCDSNRNITVKQ